ncbi:MAG: type VI secretion system-associated FHA domain protein [Desulfobacteria bacterium]
MISAAVVSELSESVRAAYRSDPAGAAARIERILGEKLAGASPEERLAAVREIRGRCEASGLPPAPVPAGNVAQEWTRLTALLLGDRVDVAKLPPGELSEKLAASLNTVFDSLNAIVGGINATLLGQKEELETIRFIIGSDLGGRKASGSLQEYLDRIQEAFAVAHRAFQEAAEKKTGELLDELSPENISSKAEGGLKFGPMKKAELWDIYEERFRTVKKALETGRLRESLLREFERSCQRMYKTERKGKS